MKRLNLTKKIHIDPQFTADDWQLYTSSMDCSGAAAELNAGLMAAVNKGFTRLETERAMHRLMDQYSEYGAFDSEPCWFLETLLDHIYGDKFD